MSYNDLIYRDLESSLSIKKKLLERYSIESKNRDLIRQQILNTENYEEYLRNKNISFSRLNQLSVEEIAFVKEQIDFHHMKIDVEHSLLKESVNKYNSEVDTKKLLLEGKLRELRSKLSVLKGKSAIQRFIIKEEFLNFFNLNNMRSSGSALNVSTESEVLTLPVAEESLASVNKIFISNESNCVPGSFTEGKNKYIYSIVDNNEDTVFEAYKEGDGPLVLDITFDFKREFVVNELIVGQLPNRGSSSIEIDDVYYSDSNNKTYNLKKLIDVDYQNLNLLKSNNKLDLSIKHLPVRASQAKVVLKVKEFSKINNLEVFSIGLKKVLFKSIKYKSKGEINSNTFNIPENYFEVSYKEKSIPKNKITFKTDMEVSLDNGGVYSEVEDGLSLITDGREKQLVYKYKLERDGKALSKINEILDDDYFVNIEANTTLINKNISPLNYNIPFEGTLRDSLKVVQNKILSRGDSLSRRVVIGKIKNSGENTFKLESSLAKYEDEEILLYLNKEKISRVYNEIDLGPKSSWFLNPDAKTIKVFTEKTQPALEVSLLIKPLLPVIEKKPEGYYIKIDENFDYDKNTLRIMCVTGTSKRIEEKIPSSKELVFLENSYLDANSISIESYTEEGGWVEVAIEDVEVNVLDGILRFGEDLIDDEKRINYNYFETKVLSSNEYEIWVKDNVVKGLFVYPQNISFEEKVDTLGSANSNRYYLFDGSYSSARSDSGSNKSFVLSNANIIKGSLSVSENLFDEDFKEVDYIDGMTEFLNIERMQKDIVPSLEKNSLGQVSFSLQEVPYSTGLLSTKVKLFDKNGQELPEANVASINGRVATITLNVNDNVSTGYYLSYYYQVEENEFKSYSVNYLDGVLYTSEEVRTQEEAIVVNYKIGRLGVEYYIYNDINNFEVDYKNSNIKVRTEEFFEINNNIKFLAFSNKDKVSLEGLEEYYSPIIYNLEIGLN